MLRLLLEQALLPLFERALEPIDRARVQRLVREAIASDRPDLLREIVRELSMWGPLERSAREWIERVGERAAAAGSASQAPPGDTDGPEGAP